MPIITCIPWNPVAIKKVLPYTPSEIEKEASLYSTHCIIKKYTPKRTVTNKPEKVREKELSIRAWWAQVTVTPLVNKIIVFNKGTE